MDKDDLSVRASYLRCCVSEGFFETFYESFLASSPAVAEKFAETDLDEQKRVLKESIFRMVLDTEEGEREREEVARIGESHSRRGRHIEPELYGLWLDSLCQAIEQHDPSYTQELEALWRRKMQAVIDRIVALF